MGGLLERGLTGEEASVLWSTYYVSSTVLETLLTWLLGEVKPLSPGHKQIGNWWTQVCLAILCNSQGAPFQEQWMQSKIFTGRVRRYGESREAREEVTWGLASATWGKVHACLGSPLSHSHPEAYTCPVPKTWEEGLWQICPFYYHLSSSHFPSLALCPGKLTSTGCSSLWLPEGSSNGRGRGWGASAQLCLPQHAFLAIASIPSSPRLPPGGDPSKAPLLLGSGSSISALSNLNVPGCLAPLHTLN